MLWYVEEGQPPTDRSFFAELAAFDDFREVTNLAHYRPVPPSWRVVITDVRGSTGAIAEGRYKEVNVLGAASIAGALNACERIKLPYCFGGDGATILVPDGSFEPVAAALQELALVARNAFELDLRVGAVDVAELYRRGFDLWVAKFAPSPGLELAMFAGDGLNEAVRLVKGADTEADYSIAAEHPGDAAPGAAFEGLHCRWRPVPSRHGQIVSLIVSAEARDDEGRSHTYRRVLSFLEELVGGNDIGPVSAETLALAGDVEELNAESALQTGKGRGLRFRLYRRKVKLVTTVGASLLRRKKKLGDFDGKRYPAAIVANSDYRKFDGTLRMVLDLTAEQAERLRAFLEHGTRTGELRFGMHSSAEALMTCLVYDHDQDHVHFIDGADGGYAAAAASLKDSCADAEAPAEDSPGVSARAGRGNSTGGQLP